MYCSFRALSSIKDFKDQQEIWLNQRYFGFAGKGYNACGSPAAGKGRDASKTVGAY